MLDSQDENIDEVVIQEIGSLMLEKELPKREIAHSDELVAHLGLQSLDLAQLIVALELRLDADPFASDIPITSIRNVGDLIKAYEQFFNDDISEIESHGLLAMQEAQRRAASRSKN